MYFADPQNVTSTGTIATELGDKFMLIRWERFKQWDTISECLYLVTVSTSKIRCLFDCFVFCGIILSPASVKHMKHFSLFLLCSALWLSEMQPALSQGSADYGSGLKFNLNPEGTKYARFIVWSQFWFRQTQMNPGTLVNGVPTSSVSDIMARRIRFLGYAQITPRYPILMHFGITSGGGSGTAGTGGYGQARNHKFSFMMSGTNTQWFRQARTRLAKPSRIPCIWVLVCTIGTAFCG